jgi:hypothetical protein
MEDHGDFDSVSWPHEPEQEGSQHPATRPDAHGSSHPPRAVNGKRSMSEPIELQAGEYADAVDLGGIGNGVLECTVDTPLKENDGTKDAYVSYLITTHVCLPFLDRISPIAHMADLPLDRLQIVPEVRLFSSPTLHRLCLPPPNAPPRVPSLRRSPTS